MTTPRDLDRLSAYLDNQLSPAEKAGLEARLAGEPGLRSALTDLRVTVRLLRALPTVKPPRSFTLTAAQAEAVRRPRGLRLFPALRLATAFAAVALIFVLVVDWSSSRGSLASAPREVQSFAVESTTAPTPAAQQEMDVAPTEAPVGLSAEATSATASKAATVEATAAASEAAIAAPALTPPPGAAGGLPGAPPAVTETPGDAARAMAAPTETPMAVADSALTASSTEALAVPPAEAPAPAQAPTPLVTPPLRYVEVGLAALVVLLAVVAWLARGS